MRLTNGTVCRPEGLTRKTDLIIGEDGRLALTPCGRASDDQVVDLGGAYVLPGFIEIHAHGAGLFELTMGQYDPGTGQFDGSEVAYEENLPRYAQLRGSTGVTNLYVGTWAAPVEQQQSSFRQLEKYVESQSNGRDGSFIVGGLLEGSFINPEMAGAQNPKFVFQPDVDLFNRMNETGVIRMVNVVPDWGQPAYELTEYLTHRGISVGAGHSRASHEQFRRAIDRGLKYFIHLLNGPTGSSYKVFDDGGALEAALQEDIHVEIIMDGIHVAPWYVRDVLARKGTDHVMTVADSMFSSQAEGITEFSVGGIKGRVHESGRYAYVVDRDPVTLFSSLLTMDVAFSNLLSWLTRQAQGVWYRQHDAIDLEQAVVVAARCCSKNIVEMLRKNGGDDLETGELVDGKWADLVVADITGQAGDYKLAVRQAYVRGRKIFDAASD